MAYFQEKSEEQKCKDRVETQQTMLDYPSSAENDRSRCKRCMELAFKDPMWKVTCFMCGVDSNYYSVKIKKRDLVLEGKQCLEFEIVYPIYKALTEIIEKKTTPGTRNIKLVVS